jgi:hypothetical protein
VLLLLTTAADGTALGSRAGAYLSRRLPPNVGFRRWQRDSTVTFSAGVPTAEPGVFEAALEVTGPDLEAAVSPTSRLAEWIGPSLDRSRSAVVAGRAYPILPGDGDAVVAYALRRLPSLSVSEFQHYWLDIHAEFGRRALAGRGYLQIHSDPAVCLSAAAAVGVGQADFDGVVITSCQTWAQRLEHQARSGSGDDSSAALADEQNFIDHARSMAVAFNVVEVYEPPDSRAGP